MLSLMLSAQRLGQQVLPVVERYGEFEQLLRSPSVRSRCRGWRCG